MTSVNRIIKEKYDNWTFIVPISGVSLSETFYNEFRIKRCTLITDEKLKRVRKRFGVYQKLSSYRIKLHDNLLNESKILAVIRYTGKPRNFIDKCLKYIQDELAILSVSMLGYDKRRYGAAPTILGKSVVNRVIYALLSGSCSDATLNYALEGKPDTLYLNKKWKDYHKNFFFHKLHRIINGDFYLNREWRNTIERASVLIGKSFCSNELVQAFLMNMFALELLLTEQNDKYSIELPKRIEAFIGWTGLWDEENYPEAIKRIYVKRCKIVHAGQLETITVEDLLLTDDLLFNIMNNIVQHINIFPDKKSLIEFSNKVQAEKTLGIKSKIRPKSFSHMSRYYSRSDKKQI